MYKKLAGLLLWTVVLMPLPDLGNKTEEYKDCMRQCQYIYNPEYLRLGAELTRLVEWYQKGIIPDHEYIEARTAIERELQRIMPIIKRQ
jgi:hypothetical protein